MRKVLLTLSLFSFPFFVGAQLYINEVQSANFKTLLDEDLDADNWIEIYNAGSSTVNLDGFGISDRNLPTAKWTFPNLNLPAGGYLTVFCDGKDRTTFPLHANFGIIKQGETVYLYNNSNSIIDSIVVPELMKDISYGRKVSNINDFAYYAEPTPAAINSTTEYLGFLKPPTFNVPGGIYPNNQNLSFSHPEQGVTIRYTRDGNAPNSMSQAYSLPIVLTQVSGVPDKFALIPTNPGLNFPFGSYATSRANTRGWVPPADTTRKANIVQAIATKNGYIPSEVVGEWYLIQAGGNPFGIPIISITADSADIFSNETGFYVYGNHPDGNYRQTGRDWERPVQVQFFEPNGQRALNMQMGARAHGGGGRHSAVKTMRLYARSAYGESHINYPILGEGNGERFKRLLVRGPGHRPDCIMRDDMSTAFTKGLNLDVANIRPVVFFLNGEYWGLFTLKERMDARQIELNYQIDVDDIVILEKSVNDTDDVYHGYPSDFDEFNQLALHLDSVDMTTPEMYEYGKMRIDLEALTEYNAVQTYFGNGDWPNNNYRFWKKRMPVDTNLAPGYDGRWRFILFDLDAGFGGDCTGIFPASPSLRRAISDSSIFRDYNVMFRNMVKNPRYRDEFATRCADLANTTFRPHRVEAILNDHFNLLDPLIFEHVVRWRYPSGVNTLQDRYQETPSLGPWNDIKNGMLNFVNQRPFFYRRHIMQELGPSDTSRVTLDVIDFSMGFVKINTIDINESTHGVNPSQVYPWDGVYFHDLAVALQAKPRPGYKFVRWDGINDTNQVIYVFITGDTSFTAIFEPGPIPFNDNIFINEVASSNSSFIADLYGEYDDWVELYNPHGLDVDISGYYVSDKSNNPTKYKLPNSSKLVVPAGGYLLLWADDQPGQGPEHLPFKLSQSGESFTLYRPDGQSKVDGIDFGFIPTNQSYGRNGDGNATWVTYLIPTPNAENKVITSVENHNRNIPNRGVYPNPVGDMLRFSRLGSGSLHDLMGRTILEFNNTQDLDVSTLQNGVYIILFNDGDKHKIIKR